VVRRRTFAAVSAALLIAARVACAAAQASPPAQAAGKRALVLFSGDVPNREDWVSSLESGLLRSGAIAAVARASGEGPVAEEAARRGFDLALELRVETLAAPPDVAPERGGAAAEASPGGRSIKAGWSVYAQASPEPIASGSFEADEEPELRRLGEFWDGIIPAVEAAAAQIGQAGLATLTVIGPAGAIVSGLGPEPLELPAEGELRLALPFPATYPWRSTLAGTMPERGATTLGAEGAKIELDPRPLRPWRIETGLLVASYPDFWASRRFDGDRFYLRFGFYQYFLGLCLDEEDSWNASFFESRPLIQPGIGGGIFFLKPDSPLRPYAGASTSVRLVIPSANLIYFDPVAPFSLGIHLGLEWSPLVRWSFFFESMGELYLFGDGELMAASRDSGGSEPIYGSTWFLDIPLMRFGARFAL
jgi:hypothetical protein